MSSGNGVLRMGEKNVENKEQRERYHTLSALVLVTSPGLKGQQIPQDMVQFVLTPDCFSFLGRSNVLNATDPEPSGSQTQLRPPPTARRPARGGAVRDGRMGRGHMNRRLFEDGWDCEQKNRRLGQDLKKSSIKRCPLTPLLPSPPLTRHPAPRASGTIFAIGDCTATSVVRCEAKDMMSSIHIIPFLIIPSPTCPIIVPYRILYHSCIIYVSLSTASCCYSLSLSALLSVRDQDDLGHHHALTAQVASQQGHLLGGCSRGLRGGRRANETSLGQGSEATKEVNSEATGNSEKSETSDTASSDSTEDMEKQLAGSNSGPSTTPTLVYIGSDEAIADLPFMNGNIASSGVLTYLFWRSAYLSTFFSLCNRTLVTVNDWVITKAFGRDLNAMDVLFGISFFDVEFHWALSTTFLLGIFIGPGLGIVILVGTFVLIQKREFHQSVEGSEDIRQ
ncbi:hypothetical protein C8J56DRAFT_1119795 [Mycena floridula]|nr:hypothetical protein C8J56DRAFT_1119795 [Mycena floridula]